MQLPPSQVMSMPFHMSEPFLEGGLWNFWLVVDENTLQFVNHLPFVLTVAFKGFTPVRGGDDWVMIGINPHYDYEKVWLWIYHLLEGESHQVELGERWEAALNTAITGENRDVPDAG